VLGERRTSDCGETGGQGQKIGKQESTAYYGKKKALGKKSVRARREVRRAAGGKGADNLF